MPLKTLLHIGFRVLVLFALNAPSRNFALKDHLGRPNLIHHPHALDSSGLDEQQGFSGSEGTPTRSAQNFGDKRSGSHGPPQRAPRYMQRLYEQYLTGEPVRSDSQVVDTVRNIVADLAIVKNSSIFIFNLSSVDEKEEILKAEVHMYKRRSKPDPQTKEIGSITVHVYELGLGYLRQRASFHLPESGHARWHVFDVTPVIRSVAPGSRRDEAAADGMLAVSFEADDGSAAGGSRGANLRLSKVLRRFSRPSLIVFSRDNEEKHPGDGLDAVSAENEDDDDEEEDPNSEKESWRWNRDDQMRSRRRHHPVAAAGKHRIKVSARRSHHPQQRNPGAGLTPERNHSAVDDDIFEMESFSIPGGGQGHWMTLKGHELEEEIGGDGRVRFFHADLSPPGAVERNRVPGFLERSGRRNKREKRSANDNEVLQKEDETTKEEEEEEEEEEEPEVRFLYNALPETNPGILKGRRDSGRRRFPATTASPILAFGEIGDDEDSAKQRRRKRKKEEERRARDRGSSLAVFVSRVGYQRRRGPSGRSDPSSSLPSSGACRKRELTVNFADIGWRDWIISPSSFEANYCDGSCLYPMASRLRPTNHATIQSIVNAIGLLERVPSPCCVPSSLSSVTLLYLDQNENVVLKNFPDMTVRSCACR